MTPWPGEGFYDCFNDFVGYHAFRKRGDDGIQLSLIGVSAAYITVIYVDANGVQTTLSPSQYAISLNAAVAGQIWGIGGTVTYPIVGSPIAAGTQLIIRRSIPLTQTTALSNQGASYPQATETALDILEMQIQQMSADRIATAADREQCDLDRAATGVDAANAAASAAAAAASAAALPNGASTGTGNIPQWNGSSWVGVSPNSVQVRNTVLHGDNVNGPHRSSQWAPGSRPRLQQRSR